MKKGLLALAMVAALGMVANVALTETVWFPYFQHGWGLETWLTMTNTSDTQTVDVTVNLLKSDKFWSDPTIPDLLATTTVTVEPQAQGIAWTRDDWYQVDGYGIPGVAKEWAGFGNFEITWPGAPEAAVYLWGTIYSDLVGQRPGFTLVLPGNPYGAGL